MGKVYQVLLFSFIVFILSIPLVSGIAGIQPIQFTPELYGLMVGISLISAIVIRYRHIGTAFLFAFITIFGTALLYDITSIQLVVAIILSATFGVLHSRSKLWLLATSILFLWMIIGSYFMVGTSCLVVHGIVSWADKIAQQTPTIKKPIYQLWGHRIAILIFSIGYFIIIGLFGILFRFIDVMSEGTAIVFNGNSLPVENIGQYLYLSSISIVSGPPNNVVVNSPLTQFLIGFEIFLGIALIVIYLQEVLQQSKKDKMNIP